MSYRSAIRRLTLQTANQRQQARENYVLAGGNRAVSCNSLPQLCRNFQEEKNYFGSINTRDECSSHDQVNNGLKRRRSFGDVRECSSVVISDENESGEDGGHAVRDAGVFSGAVRSGLQSLAGSIWYRPTRGMAGSAQTAAMDVDVWSLPLPPAVEDVQKQDQGRGPQWVFLGCPGVGKGTYASRLSKLLDVPHIAMGDLVRNELKGSSPLSKQLSDLMKAGKLLPDEITFNMLSTRLERGLAAGEKGFILDGFPRTVSQAEVLEDVTEIDLVVNLKLREDVLISKCLGRRICSQCGGNFNLAKIDVKGEDGAPNIFMPPLLPPPSCASKMTIRADDTDEVVRARLRVYQEESAPVEEFYRSRGKLLDFNVGGGIPETWPNLLAALKLTEKGDERGAQRKLVA